MTKKEILEMIDMNLLVMRKNEFMQLIKPHGCIRDESRWFPPITELKDEFEILKKEVKQFLDIKNTIDHSECNHAIRLTSSGLFFSTSSCVLCGKTMFGDNVTDGTTIYNDINRNRNCVMLDKKYHDEDGYLHEGYTLEEVYDMIKDILKDKVDDEKVDLLNEFKKLNLKKCKIDERPIVKEYYVLIIGGNNKYYLNDDQYVTRDKILDSIDIAYFLCGVPKVKVELFENTDAHETQRLKEKFDHISNIRFDTYETLEELERKVNKESHVPFDLIIDMSSLIKANETEIVPYNLELREKFPNTHIINISHYKMKTQQELLELLKENLLKYNTAYLNYAKRYYYANGENLEPMDLNQTCQKIKKIVLRKDDE